MAIEVIHRGHIIRYNENAEEWYVMDMSGTKDYSSKSLGKLRQGIDKMYLERRKKAAIPVLEITSTGGADSLVQLNDAMATEYLGFYKSKYSWEGDHHKVAVSASRSGKEKMSRKEMPITGIALDTPEVRDAYTAYYAVYQQARELDKQAKELLAAIPRVKVEDLGELVEIYNRQQQIEASE